MVSKLALPYLCDLCPDLGIFAYFTSVQIGTKNCFLFLSIEWWKSSVRDTYILFSGHFKAQSVLAVSNPLIVLGIVQRQYLTLTCDLILRKIAVQHQPALFAIHLLKILNTIFCTAQV